MRRQAILIGQRSICAWREQHVIQEVRIRAPFWNQFVHFTCTRTSNIETNNKLESPISARFLSDEPMSKTAVFSWLNLHSFTKEEISEVADRLVRHSQDEEGKSKLSVERIGKSNTEYLTENGIKAHLMQRIKSRMRRRVAQNGDLYNDKDIHIIHAYVAQQARSLFMAFKSQRNRRHSIVEQELSTPHQILRNDFESKLIEMASAIEYRKILPISLSMVMIGSSVGITTPVMPFIVSKLGLSASEFGMAASSFAAAKMIGNFPAAVLVERHGRKPYLVYSLSLVALGVGGIGLATNMEELVMCRLLSGIGVAAISTASTMMVADISTPLNRASTLAPIMSGFAAGTALGPAIGGILADRIGVEPTFFAVGASFLGLTAINKFLLSETKPATFSFPWENESETRLLTEKVSTFDAVNNAFAQWKPLMSINQVRNVVILNGLYWFALSGAQMTCLPLLLTDPNGSYAMTATSVGQVYMGMSILQVLSNPITARVADKIGKSKVIIGGGSILSLSILAMSISTNMYELASAMGFWTLGSTMLSTAPVAHISDLVPSKSRAQAIALLRTSGDIGFFLGASSIGLVGDITGDLGTAMQSGAGLLLTGTAWYGARQLLIRDQGNKSSMT